jgi:acyl-CoA dehydrogenase
MSVGDELLQPFCALLKDITSVATIRTAECGIAPPGMWEAIVASGFADALVGEKRGGAGLSMADVQPLFVTCGEHLLPVALGQTMLARAVISSAGQTVPSEPIVLWPQSPRRQLRSLVPPAASEGVLALTQCGPTMQVRRLQADAQSVDGFGLVPAALVDEPPLLEFDAPEMDLLDYAATAVAASMAGAMTRLVEMSLDFANERRQFGRPLSAFQAIQHQLAVAAQQVVLANSAARIAFANDYVALDSSRVAIAKVIANDAASAVCSVAHAVHGAIGISREYDLQLYSRRLRRWQVSFGSTEFWARRIGAARLADNRAQSVDFIRGVLGR